MTKRKLKKVRVCKYLFLLLVLIIVILGSFPTLGNEEEPKFVPGQIIVKFKPNVSVSQTSNREPQTNIESLNNLFKKLKVKKIEEVFKTTAPKTQNGKAGLMAAAKSLIQKIKDKFPLRTARAPKDATIPDLSRVYKLNLPEDVDIEAIMNQIKNDPNVEYVEPNYRMGTFR